MAGLVPAIHVFAASRLTSKTWMPGPRPGMTVLLLALRKSKML
jgi:hypothetical protein